MKRKQGSLYQMMAPMFPEGKTEPQLQRCINPKRSPKCPE